MDPKHIARILSEDITVHNGLLYEDDLPTDKVPYTCPKCPICGKTEVVQIPRFVVEAIHDLVFDETDHGLDTDTVMLIRSGVHPECFQSRGYIPSHMAAGEADSSDQWKTGDLAFFGGYFDSIDRPQPPISEDDR